MLLSELLRPDLIKMRLEAVSKKEAVAELVDLLIQQYEISLAQRAAILEALEEHDAKVSSGLAHEIALPHAYTDRVEDIIAALGIAPNGIPFDSPDGSLAKVVVLLLLPKRHFTADVRTLAGVAHLLDSPQLRAALLEAQTPLAAYETIKDAEASLLTRTASSTHS